MNGKEGNGLLDNDGWDGVCLGTIRKSGFSEAQRKGRASWNKDSERGLPLCLLQGRAEEQTLKFLISPGWSS